jgi:hypothetical protein
MDANNVAKALAAHLKVKKLKELQELCARAALPEAGQRTVLFEHLVEAARVDGIDFSQCDLDDLALMQIYARAVAEKLPTTGRRSEMQARLAKHLMREDSQKDSPNKTYLSKADLNVGGSKQDRAARRAIFANGGFDTAFEDLELQGLRDVADMFGVEATSLTRTTLLKTLRRHHAEWQKRKGKRGTREDGATGGAEADPKRRKQGQADEPLLDDQIQEVLLLRQQLAEAQERAMRAEQGAHIIEDGEPDLAAPRVGGATSPEQAAILQALLSISRSNECLLANIKDKAGEGSTSDGSKSSGKVKEGKALIDHLSKIEPHRVKLEYGNDPEVFGLHVHRALEFYSDSDLDTGLVGFASQTETLKTTILDSFHAGAEDAVRHYDAETEFAALVARLLGIAGNHEAKAGTADAVVARAEQVRDFNTAWARMKKELKGVTARLRRGDEFYKKQINMCATAAFGTIISRSAIKSMAKQDEWRESLEKRYNATNPPRNGDQAAVTETLIRSVIAGMHGGAKTLAPVGTRGAITPAGGRVKESTLGNPGGGGSGARSNGRAPPPEDTGGNSNILGLTMPLAKSVVGANVKGAIHKTGKCSGCAQAGHDDVECPTLFAAAFAGRSLPGWNESGVKAAHMWDGDKITGQCLAQWKQMQAIGFFVKTPGSKRAAPAYELA